MQILFILSKDFYDRINKMNKMGKISGKFCSSCLKTSAFLASWRLNGNLTGENGGNRGFCDCLPGFVIVQVAGLFPLTSDQRHD